MTTTNDTKTALTAENLKALRNADDLVFRFYTPDNLHAEPAGTRVEALKGNDPNDGFGERMRRVEIPLPSAEIRNYTGTSWVREEGEPRKPRRDVVSASWVVHTKYHGPGRTLVQFLKAGDRLIPVFLVSNDSETIERAGLTVDELRVVVERGPVDQPGKVKQFEFLLDVSTYHPLSPARNISTIARAVTSS